MYNLTEEGTIWPRDCFDSLSRTKDPNIYGYRQYWKRSKFDIVKVKNQKSDDTKRNV